MKASHRQASNEGVAYLSDEYFHYYRLALEEARKRGMEVVLYDEPTRSLDPLSTANIHQWLIENRRRHPETAHLIATNQLREAELLCDRVIIINADAAATHQSVIHVMEAARIAGLVRITFATQSTPK